VGICFVLLLVRGTRKWVAVIYLHSKLKLSLHKIPQYLTYREPGAGAGSREQGAGSRGAGAGSRAPGTECLLRIGPLVIGAGCWKLVFFSTRRRVRLKMRWLADVDKLDNSPGHRAGAPSASDPGYWIPGSSAGINFLKFRFRPCGGGKEKPRSEARLIFSYPLLLGYQGRGIKLPTFWGLGGWEGLLFQRL
jgi:hypothetical protein